TDYPEFAIETVAEMFKQWLRDKQAGILDYRDRSYRSTITGTLAPLHHTRWMEAMDDSLEAFLRQEPAATASVPATAPARPAAHAQPARRAAMRAAEPASA